MQWFNCVNLPGLRDTQETGKTLFLDVPVGMTPEVISILITRFRKENCSQSMRGDIIHFLAVLNG